jgi:hypothetical protein
VHEIVSGDSGGQDPYPNLAGLGLGYILFHHLQYVRPAVPGHDDAMMFHAK